MNLEKLRQAIGGGRYEWRQHVIERLVERNISQADIVQAILEGEELKDYPEDRPYPSALFFAEMSGSPLHTVVAYDEENDWAYIITAYVPDLEHFENDFKTRRKE